MYGSGRSGDPVHSGNTGVLTCEGSHFDSPRDIPRGVGLGSSNIGNSPTTAGPHSSDLANKVDPRVESGMDSSRTVGNTTGVYGSTGRSSTPGAFESDSNPYNTQELDPRLGGPTTTSTTGVYRDNPKYTGTTDTLGHHYDRDATIGAGGVGLAEHEHRKLERESGIGGTTTDPSTGPAPNTDGPHSKDWMNKLDPRVNSNTDNANTGLTGTCGATHGGRDAVAAAGLTGAGYETEKHHAARNEPGVGGTLTKVYQTSIIHAEMLLL